MKKHGNKNKKHSQMYKDVGLACQQIYKQGRDDIKAKPHPFLHLFTTEKCEKWL